MTELKWNRTTNTESLVIYRSGRYTIKGHNQYEPGKKVVRRWNVFFKNTDTFADEIISTPARFIEAKRDAQYHADQHPNDLTVYAVVVANQFDGLNYLAFHRSEEGAAGAAKAYNAKYPVGPRALVKPVTVVE